MYLTKCLLVLAQYVFKMTDHTPTDWQTKGVAVAGYTLAIIRMSPNILHEWFL